MVNFNNIFQNILQYGVKIAKEYSESSASGITRNAALCNSRDNLANLSFSLKVSVFSEATFFAKMAESR